MFKAFLRIETIGGQIYNFNTVKRDFVDGADFLENGASFVKELLSDVKIHDGIKYVVFASNDQMVFIPINKISAASLVLCKKNSVNL